MADPHSPFHFVPRQATGRVGGEISLPALEFFFLPLVNGHVVIREVIPQIVNQLKFFGWREIKY
jgi:hypothetical protein